MNQSPNLYPLKFTPILKKKIWGGDKLKLLFNKQAEGNIGESWEISGVEGNISILQNGSLKGRTLNKLIKEYKGILVGDKVYKSFGNKFPLLFKFIDAYEDLSVQLHPDDTLAKKRHNSFGKTEMWYILDADEKGRLILGFNREMNEAIYKKHLSNKTLPQILHSEKVKAGDSFFIEPGTVHAIGAGVVLAEIQQTSDITYRIYDYNRPDIGGNLRELHTDLALKAINYQKTDAKLKYMQKENEPVQLCKSPFFQTNKLSLTESINRDLDKIDSFVVYMCVKGDGIIELNGISETIKKGETILIPSLFKNVKIKTNSATLLEVYIP